MNKHKAIHMMNVNPTVGSSIAEILSLAHSCVEQEEYNSARTLFDRAATGCHGMIEYAHFLLSVPKLDNYDQNDRIQKAKSLLFYVEQNGNKQEMCDACLILANLYRYTNEIRALGFSMRANRHGCNDDERLRNHLLKQLIKMEIADVEDDPYGCYVAGVECTRFAYDPVMLKWALYFLEMTVEKGRNAIVGIAAMRIADLYDEYTHDKKVCAYYKEIAAKNGNPEVLSKHT